MGKVKFLSKKSKKEFLNSKVFDEETRQKPKWESESS